MLPTYIFYIESDDRVRWTGNDHLNTGMCFYAEGNYVWA
jgi:hypothetical protein